VSNAALLSPLAGGRQGREKSQISAGEGRFRTLGLAESFVGGLAEGVIRRPGREIEVGEALVGDLLLGSNVDASILAKLISVAANNWTFAPLSDLKNMRLRASSKFVSSLQYASKQAKIFVSLSSA
jgi:hypothetical protein